METPFMSVAMMTAEEVIEAVAIQRMKDPFSWTMVLA
jgi:hypothetical protein